MSITVKKLIKEIKSKIDVQTVDIYLVVVYLRESPLAEKKIYEISSFDIIGPYDSEDAKVSELEVTEALELYKFNYNIQKIIGRPDLDNILMDVNDWLDYSAFEEWAGPIKSGPLKGFTTVFAPMVMSTLFKDEIEDIIEAIGLRSAIITDDSQIGDFDIDDNKLNDACVNLGINFSDDDLVWEVAQRLKHMRGE